MTAVVILLHYTLHHHVTHMARSLGMSQGNSQGLFQKDTVSTKKPHLPFTTTASALVIHTGFTIAVYTSVVHLSKVKLEWGELATEPPFMLWSMLLGYAMKLPISGFLTCQFGDSSPDRQVNARQKGGGGGGGELQCEQ